MAHASFLLVIRTTPARTFLTAVATLPLWVAVGALEFTSSSSASSAGTSPFWEASRFELEHSWTLHEGKHWQVLSPVSEEIGVTDAVEGTRGTCSPGMVEVRGRMRIDGPGGSIEAMQRSMCTQWISTELPERCGQFDEARWKAYVNELPTVDKSFCIDRYEYPNVKGQYPWVFVAWSEAAEICERDGKRLWSETEWTFACEGEDAWPYPYGYERSASACVIDRPWMEYDERKFADRSSEGALGELDRVCQGEASGSRPMCRSPFGVYDMTGNVDESTYASSHQGFRSILKGGYWAEIRARCRPSTRAHREGFALYQQGFRSCDDAL